mmetsp:Transcript_33931/g.112268  ORF Transcript_33931/g.112268 Transcript_33931/m.112268 type:complete len:299 (+) Transcript_33931:2516-3412(+)
MTRLWQRRSGGWPQTSRGRAERQRQAALPRQRSQPADTNEARTGRCESCDRAAGTWEGARGGREGLSPAHERPRSRNVVPFVLGSLSLLTRVHETQQWTDLYRCHAGKHAGVGCRDVREGVSALEKYQPKSQLTSQLINSQLERAPQGLCQQAALVYNVLEVVAHGHPCLPRFKDGIGGHLRHARCLWLRKELRPPALCAAIVEAVPHEPQLGQAGKAGDVGFEMRRSILLLLREEADSGDVAASQPQRAHQVLEHRVHRVPIVQQLVHQHHLAPRELARDNAAEELDFGRLLLPDVR